MYNPYTIYIISKYDENSIIGYEKLEGRECPVTLLPCPVTLLPIPV